MRRQLSIIGLTILALLAMDIAVGAALEVKGGGLARYFDYGRSVPGKLDRWIARPNTKGNMFDVAWRSEMIEDSAVDFAAEDPALPVVRGYGMSFANQILRASQDLDPDLRIVLRAGPSASPNFTYAAFKQDRANRRPGDVAVLGVLSSSVAAMASMSNRTWNFEQPAPFSYPIYWPEGDNLRAVEPLVNSAAAERAAMTDPTLLGPWQAQLAAEDLFHTPYAFAAPWLDVSPFARQVRRALAVGDIRRRTAAILAEDGPYPYAEVLRRMIRDFVATARADGQMPVVFLIQGRDRADPDLLAITGSTLAALNASYLATAELVDPRILSNFEPDSHYTAAANRIFAKAFADILTQGDAR
jgi:hypothetical protein